MKKKMVGIFVCTLLIAATVLPVAESMNVSKTKGVKKGIGFHDDSIVSFQVNHCWWSGEGDNLTLISPPLDLSSVATASFYFWHRYDIGNGYVKVSSDGGSTWQVLASFTGSSLEWEKARLDLSFFVGETILLMFEYMTDRLVYGEGWFIDDISLPEIGFLDDVESGPGSWVVNGWSIVETPEWKQLSETWAGPPGPHGATGTYITFFTSIDGNTWAVLGPAGLNTGIVTLNTSVNGDLLISDPVPESEGGEPSIIVVNQDENISDVVITTTIRHNSENGGGICRGGFDYSGGFGYFLAIDGEVGLVVCKSIQYGETVHLADDLILNYNTSNMYELEFSFIGETLRGRVFLGDMEVANVTTTDDTFSSGYVGVFGTTTVGQHSPPNISEAPMNVTFGDLVAAEVNHAPARPSITGLTSGKAGKEYEYTFNAIDPDGDNIKYFIDWGDDNTEWTDFHASGTDVKVKHTWSEKGTYNITAKAKDIYGAEGPEATLEVTMPKNKAFNINLLFLRFLEQHPHMFPILRQLLGL